MTDNRLLTVKEAEGTALAPLVRIRDELIRSLGLHPDVFNESDVTGRMSGIAHAANERRILYVAMYAEGLSLRNIASVCSVDTRTIANALEASNVKRRPWKGSKKKFFTPPNETC